MKLTKDSQNGFNLWVVEHNGPGVSKNRLMYQADATEVDLTNQDDRDMVAGRLWDMRSDLRALASMPPPA